MNRRRRKPRETVMQLPLEHDADRQAAPTIPAINPLIQRS